MVDRKRERVGAEATGGELLYGMIEEWGLGSTSNAM